MGKAKRIKAQRQEIPARVKISDAANLIAMAEYWDIPKALPHLSGGERGAVETAHCMLREWRNSRVALRADTDFVGALLDSETNVEMVPDWLDRLPFDSVAFSFPEPISLHDGYRLCHYSGFIATGIRTEARPTPSGSGEWAKVFTRYGSFSWGHGIRFLWLFSTPEFQTPQAQTVSVYLRGPHRKADVTTLADLIHERETAAELSKDSGGEAFGSELDQLVPISVQLMLYLVAAEPDLDWIPAAQSARPQQLRTAQVGNVGWRVGGAIRTWRGAEDDKRGPTRVTAAGGWRLPPHIRRAHWHRVRVATRAADGTVIGNRSGVKGIDWEYEMRWYPPTPVNVSDRTPPDPVVRDLAREDQP